MGYYFNDAGFENSSSSVFFKEDLPPLKVYATIPTLVKFIFEFFTTPKISPGGPKVVIFFS
jgi:hypothetical protein